MMQTNAWRLVYITARDCAQARAIGRALVEERLAACVNIFGGMNSLYWWDGAVQSDREAALIAKTRADLVAKLTRRVKDLHSYSVPCVVSLPIEGGNSDFFAWMRKETRKKRATTPRRAR